MCLESNDYIQIRNVLQVLTVLLPIYPKMTAFYAALDRRIRAICVAEKDRRHDLFALAKCYNGRLAHKHRDMIEESQFHTVSERPAPAPAVAASSTSSNVNAGKRNGPFPDWLHPTAVWSDASSTGRSTTKDPPTSTTTGDNDETSMD